MLRHPPMISSTVSTGVHSFSRAGLELLVTKSSDVGSKQCRRDDNHERHAFSKMLASLDWKCPSTSYLLINENLRQLPSGAMGTVAAARSRHFRSLLLVS